MSTYRACTVADRVVLIHDMLDQTIISELDAEQADVLLHQMQIAVGRAIAALRLRAGEPSEA